MITRINSNNVSKYSVLFKDASAKLGGDPITSLNEYFGQLSNLLDRLGNDDNEIFRYIKLPLDEDFLAIDANSRKISIPSEFSRNGIGVVGDHTAELVTFSVDRFFDHIDLGGNDIQIVIQWEGPNNVSGLSANYGKIIDNMVAGGNLESLMTEDQLATIETKAQKLLFGWAITEDMTAAAGRIRFAVHFIKKNGNELEYAFNTLPAELIVNPTLVMDETKVIQDVSENLRARITSDGVYTLGSDVPGYPNFVNRLKAVEVYRKVNSGGDYSFDSNTKTFADGTEYEKIDEGAIFDDGKALNLQPNDIVVLKTSAITSSGTLTYEWRNDTQNLSTGRYSYVPVNSGNLSITDLNEYFYKLDNEEKYLPFPYVGNFTVGNNHTITFNGQSYEIYQRQDNIEPLTGTARIEYVPVSAANIEEGHEYYRKENNIYIAIEDNSTITTGTVYERYAVYILEYQNDGSSINNYTADAISFSGINTKVNRGNDKVSILGPVKPVIENATTGVTLDEENNIYHILLTNNGTNLTVTDVSDNTNQYAHSNTYQWLQINDDATNPTSVNGATSATYAITNATAADYDVQYKCQVTSTKHGASETAVSPFVYRVTQPAAEPNIVLTGSNTTQQRNVNILGQMEPVEWEVSVPLTDLTEGMPWLLIRENRVGSELGLPEEHVITLPKTIITELGITPKANVLVQANVAVDTLDTVIRSGTILNGDTLTCNINDFVIRPAYYKLLVVNEVNGDRNYSISDWILVQDG